jgi:secreted Zn-dependent insulinase-like peptidase
MVAVTVGIGGLEDHLGYEGMAHFVEHMLLTGSKKYPAYMKYISSK